MTFSVSVRFYCIRFDHYLSLYVCFYFQFFWFFGFFCWLFLFFFLLIQCVWFCVMFYFERNQLLVFTIPETECRRWQDEFCINRRYCGLQLELDKLVVVVVVNVADDVISNNVFIDGLVLVTVFWILLMMDCVETAIAAKQLDDTVME